MTAPACIPRLCLAIAAFFPGMAAAAGNQDPEAIRFFETRIRPVLAENCYKCHGEKKQKGGLRLDNLGYMLEGGSGGTVLVPGDAAASLIFRALSHDTPDLAMPPDEEMLPAANIADFERWIGMGAPWPADEVIAPRKPGEFTAEERGWWSFQPLAKVVPPDLADPAARITNDVDRFIVAKLLDAGLPQAPPAGTRELLRRLYYNLHGLPPSEAQIQAYLTDTRPDAYERLVDELLASPRYGMRWAQHWLDLARYAESDGYREDAYRPHAWPYRDYVIRSLNEDKPYNQFVREQLAGDEIAPDDPDTLIATAFLRHGIYEWNQSDAEMQRNLIIGELAGLTGEVFLGLSLACAECHDHKFDPILQRDYYRFRAFFEPMQWRDDMPLASVSEKQAHAEAMASWEPEAAEAREAWELEGQSAIESGTKKAMMVFPPNIQEMKGKPLEERTPYEKQVTYFVDRRVALEVNRATDALKTKSEAWAAYKPLDERRPKPLPPAFIATDIGLESPPTIMKTRRTEEQVAPGFLTILAPGEAHVEPLPALSSTGRRSALADWIADPANPLSTRVIVNRVWQHHFGRGLSEHASDFGKLGEIPSHPELLDWLTSGFIENEWSLKWLHRQILLSTTYRQSSQVATSELAAEIDPANRLLWRARPQRLDAEQLRDSLLVLAGEFREKSGGPAEEGSKPVPSIFVRKQRNSPDELLARFDAPAGFHSVASRDATNTPLQSLLMANAGWPLERARTMAVRLLKERPDLADAAVMEEAVLRVFGRPALDGEIHDGAAFLQEQEERITLQREADELARARAPLVDGSRWFPEEVTAGEPSLAFKPGTDNEKILVRVAEIEDHEFTIETLVYLDALQPDAAVRTIVSRWNGNAAQGGWALGVTGEKSRFAPGQLIIQLTGEDFQGALTSEVVLSGFTIEPNRPYQIAAAISCETLPGAEFGGHIRFYVKDLSEAGGGFSEASVAHPLGGAYVNPERALVAGGRDAQGGHEWIGGIHRLAMRTGVHPPGTLEQADGHSFDLRGNAFASAANRLFEWIKPANPLTGHPPKTEAIADLFHVLINSNEFLYQP